MQSSNVDDELRARNPLLANAGKIDKNWDFNPGIGGPIKRDRVWFYRQRPYPGRLPVRPGHVLQRQREQPGEVGLRRRPEPPRIAGEDLARCAAAHDLADQPEEQARRHLHAAGFCACHDGISATTAPEAGYDRRFPTQRIVLLDWTAPVTSKVLLEASAIHRVERWGNMHLQTKGLNLDPVMIGVNRTGRRDPRPELPRAHRHLQQLVEQQPPLPLQRVVHHRLARDEGRDEQRPRVSREPDLRAATRSPTASATACRTRSRCGHCRTLQKSRRRPAISACSRRTSGPSAGRRIRCGIRYDHFANSFPEQTLGPTSFTPNRNLDVPGDEEHQLPRHHAEEPVRLRPVRQRQDSAQGQSQQVPVWARHHQRGSSP